MKMDIEFNVEALIGMVNDYFYAEFEQRQFLLTFPKGVFFPSIPAQQQVQYIKHDECTRQTWYAVSGMCRVLNINTDKLLSFVKSLNRQERKCKYAKCFTAFFNYRIIEKMTKYLLTDSKI